MCLYIYIKNLFFFYFFGGLKNYIYGGITPIIFIYLISLKKIHIKNYNIKNKNLK